MCPGSGSQAQRKLRFQPRQSGPRACTSVCLTVKNQWYNGYESVFILAMQIIAIYPSLLVFGLQLGSLTLPGRA